MSNRVSSEFRFFVFVFDIARLGGISKALSVFTRSDSNGDGKQTRRFPRTGREKMCEDPGELFWSLATRFPPPPPLNCKQNPYACPATCPCVNLKSFSRPFSVDRPLDRSYGRAEKRRHRNAGRRISRNEGKTHGNLGGVEGGEKPHGLV